MVFFEPFRVQEMTLRNRLVMPPMCMYSAHDGLASDFHVVHYGARAMGGVGLIIIEATGVLPNGRISDHCLGLWKDEQIEPLRRVVDACHRGGAKVAIQLAHAGRKCVASSVAHVVAPSQIRFSDAHEYRDPEPLTHLEIETIVEAFRSAAIRAAAAGVDAIEVHAAHGYLINQFLSPLTNRRSDDFGGSQEHRVRFLAWVLRAIRQEWPSPKPLILRVSATDYADGGITLREMMGIVGRIQKNINLLHVSSGGLLPVMPPQAPGFQVPYAAALRRETNLPVIAVGLITSVEQAEEILCQGQADLIAMGRELLRNPSMALESARRMHIALTPPRQYERAYL